MNVAVVGAGRMGLPLACAIAARGASTTVCDINHTLVDAINTGDCPYNEPGLAELMHEGLQSGLLRASTDTSAAARNAETIIIIVPAHLTREKEIDYSILRAASTAVAKGLSPGALVIYETTVSVRGTRRVLAPLLEKESGLKAGRDFFVAFSPERVKANLVLERLRTTPKVVGGYDDLSRRRALAFYSTYLGAPVDDVGTLEAAELTKLVDMLYRDVNIALANELAEFSEAVGVDFELVRKAANRNGESNLLMPGIGVGGHCTPVYPYFLTAESRRLGVIQRLAETARLVNDTQPRRHVLRLALAWQPLRGKGVHILGLGFRPGVKVDTFSSAYPLRDELLRHDAVVTLEDPYYSAEEIRRAGFTPAHAGTTGIDAIILNTAHPQYALPDFAHWAGTGVSAVLDGRSYWDPEVVTRAGLIYVGTGRGASGRTLSYPLAAGAGEG
jgi:nucleotide sugar dehydrogenase